MIYIMLVITFAILFILKTENDYDPKYKDRMTDYIITRYIYIWIIIAIFAYK